MAYSWLSLAEIKPLIPEMEKRKVSKVARSRRGFLTAYKRAGSQKALSGDWREERDNFISRHMAQVDKASDLWEDDPSGRGKRPTRRHLALIAWAYTPNQRRLKAYTKRKRRRRKNGWVKHQGVWTNLTPGQEELTRALRRGLRAQVRTEYTVPIPKRIQRTWDFPSGCPTRYHLDIAIPAYKLAVEVDGPAHRGKDREKDRVRNEVLTEIGWTIARVRKKDAVERPIAVADEIRKLIDQERPRDQSRRKRGLRDRGRRTRSRGRRTRNQRGRGIDDTDRGL